MRIEQVGIGTAPRSPFRSGGYRVQQILENLEGMIAVEHAGPEVNLPAETPASGHITALFQGVGSCRKQFGMAIGRYLVRGVEAVEMGDMTVLVFRIVGIDEPFL